MTRPVYLQTRMYPGRRWMARLGAVIALVGSVAYLRSAEARDAEMPLAISSALPSIVPANGGTPPLGDRPGFDTFSWQSFVALMWPVDPARRGVPLAPNVPATLQRAGNGYATVWGSFLSDTDLFPGGNARPIAWNGQRQPSLCGTTAPTGAKILTMISKSGSLLTDMSQSFSFPLVDQNRNYIYYEIAYNEQQYAFVRGQDAVPTSWLYRAGNLARAEMKAPIAMPIGLPGGASGAIMVKAAWKQLTPRDDASRYYTISGYVLDTTTKPVVCRAARLGLIGFHIARKVSPFPQWIWSSFEQIDNVPNAVGSPPQVPMTLNNGHAIPAATGGWFNRPASKLPQPISQRGITQVTRFNPIPTTPLGNGTTDINARWQRMLAGTPLSHYQLVITQWPASPVAQGKFQSKEMGGLYPASAGQPFPLSGAVNTSMETYFQSQNDAAGAGGNSCMQCHYTAGQADFSWSLTLRSY